MPAEPVGSQCMRSSAASNLRVSLLLLLAAVTLVLLIASGDQSAEPASEPRVGSAGDLAIRTAIGSTRARLMRQLLTESLLLGVSAALLGIGVGAAVVFYIRAAHPVELPPGATFAMNIPVLVFTTVLAVVTTVLFGFVPAWQGSKLDVGEALKSGRSSAGRFRQRTAKGLVAAEIAASIVLLAGAGLLIRSLSNFASAPLGFTPVRLITMNPQPATPSLHENRAADGSP